MGYLASKLRRIREESRRYNVIMLTMKNKLTLSARSDLYIDESGYYYIGQSKYKFFLVTAVLITPDQRELASLLMQKWRNKHLTNPYRCFHTTDFFENRNTSLQSAKPELSITRNFNNAIKELLEFLSYIEFESTVYYVDIPTIRNRLKIDNPPQDGNGKKEYSNHLKESFEELRFAPLDMGIKNAFDFNYKYLINDSKSVKNGYINIESHHQSDIRLIKSFHRYISIYPKYDTNILGLRLHNKKSLDAGIEIADLISYSSCQTLRFSHRLTDELKDIPKVRYKILKQIRSELRARNIKLYDISGDSFKYKKN